MLPRTPTPPAFPPCCGRFALAGIPSPKAITYTYSHLLQELMPSFLYLAFGFVRTSALPAIPLASGKVKASVEIGGVNPSVSPFAFFSLQCRKLSERAAGRECQR